MANSLASVLDTLQARIKSLSEDMERLKQLNKQLLEENQQLKSETSLARQERDKAVSDAEFLTMSHKLADNPDSLVMTRRQIAGLIRNIDRCIAMLKE